jgi:hypothetical protein
VTQAEFNQIKKDFDRETARYEALCKGQLIYVCTGYDNFEHEVVRVDVPNRVIHCLDHSRKGVETTLGDGHGGWHEKIRPVM